MTPLASENGMVPVKNFALMMERGGLAAAVQFFPKQRERGRQTAVAARPPLSFAVLALLVAAVTLFIVGCAKRAPLPTDEAYRFSLEGDCQAHCAQVGRAAAIDPGAMECVCLLGAP